MSPTSYTRIVRRRASETSAETRRNSVRKSCCKLCCTSAKLLPLTSSGPTSGRLTRPSRSTTQIDGQAVPGANDIVRSGGKVHGNQLRVASAVLENFRAESLRYRRPGNGLHIHVLERRD